ncbi:Hypothetical predicted protein [Mytilus galloprovincialis]|uniref:Uncharacterized protein n=1 Tax=Mytilus galloprovincialis TaxID=29158 RepID=A0A8B6F894_MYTGA|nr:Hypothetical predicted protein [Mytilus galloprovincialis]
MSNTQNKDQIENDLQASQPGVNKGRPKSVSRTENEGWNCQLCNVLYKKKTDKVLECDYCRKHNCISCLSMPATLYNHLSNRADIKWFCSLCNETVEKNLRHDREIEEKCRLFMEKFEQRVVTLETKVEQMVTVETVKTIINEEFKSEITPHSGHASATTPDDVITETVKEMKDRERRKNNAIFFNVPEPKSNVKSEKSAQDTESITDIGKRIDVEMEKRLGKKYEEENKHRPLLVTFDSDTIKRNVFKNFSKLRDESDFGSDDNNNIGISHDMTPKEKEELTQLKEKAKEKEEKSQGKFRFRVRGPPWAMYIKKLSP